MTVAEAVELAKGFLKCVAAGGHDWSNGNSCTRCTAEKDGPTLLSILNALRSDALTCYCRPCWQNIGSPIAHYFSPANEREMPCTKCKKPMSTRDLVWIRPL